MGTKEFVMVGAEKFEFDTKDLFVYEPTIKKHLSDQATQFYNVSKWAGKARALVESLTTDFKILQAELDLQVRTNFKILKEKATEAQVTAAILISDKYRGAAKALQDAQTALNTILALQSSFAHRKDCAIELARHLRAEMDISGAPRV